MKELIVSILSISLCLLMQSCSKNDSTAKGEEWVELVESKTILVKPEGWDDDYWNEVNKNVQSIKIFNTLVNAVMEGKLKAYNILTDEPLSIEDVKNAIENAQLNENGEYQSHEVTYYDLSTIRTREQWFFDEKEFQLEKKVSRIDLLIKKLNFEGEYIGDKALFYVHLNK